MLRVGLTGGIGSGKSTVCELFTHLGVPVIDADVIARELVRPGAEALQQIVALFGQQIFQRDGTLDRTRLRNLIFNDEGKRGQLESLLHPLIRQEMQRQVEALNSPYVILAIPLLLEKGWQQQLDRVLVVDCSVSLQRERVAKRDTSPPQTIDRIIASQFDRTQRLLAADDIIDNSGSLQSLHDQVMRLHHQYLTLARNN